MDSRDGVMALLARLPITLYWYDDGLHVRTAHPHWAQLAGARVLRMAGATSQVSAGRVLWARQPGEQLAGVGCSAEPNELSRTATRARRSLTNLPRSAASWK